MATIRKCRDDYTVGWIAALPIEQAAATAMLDEEHSWPEGFSKPPHDSNSYAWGRIKDKNVVIAILPAGTTGKVSAATTANQLLAAFPQVRIGLMVGIGGGVPRPDDDVDIRLGDIVVSQPSGTHGGVVQYDLGKAKVGGAFERKGYLSAPPRTLLTALAKIQGQHERYPSSVPQILAEMLEKNPRMRSKTAGYTYQGKENDRLFQASYAHIGARTCKDCDPTEEVRRDGRVATDPHIHYGIIASGDIVVKDAAFRDSVLDEVGDDCKCVEMEAAGLISDFPCIVIRGISDYADSHKNDRWHRYAAATAAAYAKELLGIIEGEDLKRETRAMNIMQNSTLDHST
ncbi:ankyrin repeat protein [Periconia macrospinosa]|uniref:Ankyrin repeat protein n=1 Tax=Periconia macrospinosa TaxID=97972 RepID=A0A2V1DRL4_9PLEO|nr:ankyrin repeat protein [Periconia macrospinosa]